MPCPQRVPPRRARPRFAAMQNLSSLFKSGWRAVAATAFAVLAALFLITRPPTVAQASPPPSTATLGGPPAAYVSSDPSVPAAVSVKFADPQPHIEAF